MSESEASSMEEVQMSGAAPLPSMAPPRQHSGPAVPNTGPLRGNPMEVTRVQAAKPEYFYGDREKLEDWLMELELYFMFDGADIPERKRGVFATTYMRGPAQKWIKPYIAKFMAHDQEVSHWMTYFSQFKEKVRAIYGISNEKTTSTRIIQYLKQTRSANEYAAIFQRHAPLTNWDDTALRDMFRRGLKDTVKEELMRYGGTIDDLEDLIRASIEIDDKLFELNLAKRFDKGKGTFATRPNPYAGMQKKFDPYGPQPMDLTNLMKGKARRAGAKSNKKFTCYNCGKPGHIAKNCRQKNKVTREFNMLAKEEGKETEQEWEILPRPVKFATPEEAFESLTIEDKPPPEDDSSFVTSFGKITRLTTGQRQQIHQEIKEECSINRLLCDDEDTGSEEEEPFFTDEEEEVLVPKKPRLTPIPILRRQDAEMCVWEFLEEEPRPPTPHPSSVIVSTTQQDLRAWEAMTKPRSFTPEPISGRLRYDWDHRNPEHDKISWTECTYDFCKLHYGNKIDNHCFPSKEFACKWKAFDCPHDGCIEHLFDKRTTGFFPGKTKDDMFLMRLVMNGQCTNHCWQVCLMDTCTTHQEDKRKNGFAPTFLDLDRATRALGLEPSMRSRRKD
jgi:hypothetical protein